MLWSRYDFNTIGRADDNARFTPRTSLLIDHRQLSRFTFANRLIGHTHDLGHLLWETTSSDLDSAVALGTDFSEDFMADLLIVYLPFEF